MFSQTSSKLTNTKSTLLDLEKEEQTLAKKCDYLVNNYNKIRKTREEEKDNMIKAMSALKS